MERHTSQWKPEAGPPRPEVPYWDRTHAARALAARLSHYAKRGDVVVLALPRGGVPVGFEVARTLGAPLDLMIVRKLGVPGQEELAVGAIASGGARVINPEVLPWVGSEALEDVVQLEQRELERRERLYRGGRPPVELESRIVILVDDGLATGASMRVAVQAVRQHRPAKIVVAVPVAPRETVNALRREADEVVCPATPEPFFAIGLWYRDFRPVSDDEVRDLLRRAWQAPAPSAQPERTVRTREVTLQAAGVDLTGILSVPRGATGVVIFAHGSGSSRFSPRNRFVASVLNEAKLATLMFDLLTADEERVDERTRELRFDIDLLARRLVGAIDWARQAPETATLGIGLFGASTGAAAALRAAAERPEAVRAVVSRGGRPDLAGEEALARVRAPTLLIVGAYDRTVLGLNRQASAVLGATNRLEVVAGATHLFEEPGTLDEAARLATEWFRRYLCSVVP